jgi:putative transposase
MHAEALRQADRSPRSLSYWLTDHAGFAISESTVYRVLKRHGLIREVKLVGFPAGPEYRVKTIRSNEQWQSDASDFFVVGWGWYFLISVLDDYLRFILAWDLKAEQTAEAISEVVQQAVRWTGMPAAPVETRARLLTDRGSGSLVAAFEDSLRALQIRHIDCAPNGTLERVHETLKARLNLLVSRSPEVLRAAMADCIRIDNHERDHEGIGPGTPPMCLTASGRRFSGGGRPKRAGPSPGVFATIGPQPGSAPGALPGDLSVPCSLTESQRC